MNVDHERVKSIFLEALEKSTPDGRSEYLERACRGDSHLRRRVEVLLRAHNGGDSLLDAPAAGATRWVLGEDRLEQPGDIVGPYKLREEIGEGGFGVVYMAEQEDPVRRRVALKVIKPGMDSREVIARFDAERQALALMDHPNVARVLDAGATRQGRPFFVMDLIKGIAITEYADEASLSTRERLDLFLEVCGGVEHAHQKGIIHRDLKPSNVLVTLHGARAVPKVIDFGVAKAIHQRLTERTLFTRHAQMVGTPLYMSPEQAALSGLDVDTRSDIYSLGVLLYELLTGTTPLERGQLGEASFDEIRRAIRETEPPTPSERLATTEIESLRAIAARRKVEPRRAAELLRGDLDWIVMRALEKDRARRYETVNAFAADVRRYLADEPVEARPPSRWYRARKFARRNRGGLWIAACVIIALAAVIGSAGWLVGERAARLGAAARQAERALEDVAAAIKEQDWSAARMAVARAEGFVVSRGTGPEVAAHVAAFRRDLDMVARLEAIQLELASRPTTTRFDYAGAAEDYERAFVEYGLPVETLPVREAAARIRRRKIALELAAGLEQWATSLKQAKAKEEAGWKRLLSVAAAADPDPLRSRIRELWKAGDDKALGELAEATPPDGLSAFSARVIAAALRRAGALERAVAYLERAQQLDPGDFWINYYLVSYSLQLKRWDDAARFGMIAVALRPESSGAHSALGFALREKRLVEKAITEFHEAIRLDPNSAFAHNNLGVALTDKGLFDEAIQECREAIRLAPNFAFAHNNLGTALEKKGLPDEAMAAQREAVRLAPDSAVFRTNLGLTLGKRGLLDEAIAAYREAIRRDSNFALAHHSLGFALVQKNLVDEAIDAYREAIRLEPKNTRNHSALAFALRKKGLVDEAINELREAIRLDPDDARARYNLGVTLGKKSLLRDAIQEYREAVRLAPKFSQARVALGRALGKEGSPEDAIAAFREAIRLTPNYAEAHFALGQALTERDLDEAISAYRKAVRLAPNDAGAHNNLGFTLWKKGVLDEAAAEYREAVRLDPDFVMAHYNLSVALRDNGQLEEALKACREVVRLQPDFTPAYPNLAVILQRSGRMEEAIALWSKVLSRQPTNAPLHNHLAWLLVTLPDARLRDPKRAVKLAKKAVKLAPGAGSFWNTLGVAHYRAADYNAAVGALTKSMELQKGGDGFDWLFVAMSHWQLGRKDQAREWHRKAVEWIEKNAKIAKEDAELLRFRDEAEALLSREPRDAGEE